MLKWIIVAIGMAAGNVFGQALDGHAWKHRVLVIHAEMLTPREFWEQLGEFTQHWDQMAERKVVLYSLVEDQCRFTDFQQTSKLGDFGPCADDLLHFKESGETPFITLLGLDGSIKLERSELLTHQELFGIIDAMPMRRQELRNKD